MADDETSTSDEAPREDSRFEGIRVEFQSGEFGEVRIRRRRDESDGDKSEAADSDETKSELRVSRHDRAAARCGRWGDEQWR